MQNLVEAEGRVRKMVRKMLEDGAHDERRQADLIAGDVAAQCYHYLIAVAHAELAIRQAASAR